MPAFVRALSCLAGLFIHTRSVAVIYPQPLCHLFHIKGLCAPPIIRKVRIRCRRRANVGSGEGCWKHLFSLRFFGSLESTGIDKNAGNGRMLLHLIGAQLAAGSLGHLERTTTARVDIHRRFSRIRLPRRAPAERPGKCEMLHSLRARSCSLTIDQIIHVGACR